MAQALFAMSNNPYVLLLLVNVLLLFLGCLMEGTALLIILTPILAPVFFKLGVDPVHFGLVIVLNLTIGAVTPPVGTILYTVCAIVGLSIEELTRELGPFLLAFILVLFVVTYVPPTVLWLPNLMMGRKGARRPPPPVLARPVRHRDAVKVSGIYLLVLLPGLPRHRLLPRYHADRPETRPSLLDASTAHVLHRRLVSGSVLWHSPRRLCGIAG